MASGKLIMMGIFSLAVGFILYTSISPVAAVLAISLGSVLLVLGFVFPAPRDY